MADLSFLLIVERGALEAQAVLLVDSLRAFGGPWRAARVWAVQPRPGPLPSRRTLDELARLGARYVRADLNTAWTDYGPGNKPYAAAFIEALEEGRSRAVVLLDSDVLFVRPPRALVLDSATAIAVRPVDQPILGLPAGERPGPWWRFLYDLCGVEEDRRWSVRTTAGSVPIGAYFNAGLVAVRPEFGLFRRWRDAMDGAAAHRHDATIFPTPREVRFLDQGTLASVILAALPRERVRVLPPAYNYPLHKHASLEDGVRIARLDDAVVAHYHDEFYATGWMSRLELSDAHRRWLEQRLPLPGLWPRLRRAGRAAVMRAGSRRGPAPKRSLEPAPGGDAEAVGG